MATKSHIARNEKLKVKVEKFRAVRAELRKVIKDANATPDEKFEAQAKMAKLPRKSIETRVRNRCLISGRPRAFLRKFQMSRIAFRDAASRGLLPGVIKASW